MALASTMNVSLRLGRALTDEETVLAAVLLEDVESMLMVKLPSLLTTAADDEVYLGRAIAVECAAVVRVLRNPEGYRSEQSGPFSYTLDTRAAAGFLTILADEWRQLGYITAFSIDTTPSVLPTTVPYTVYDLMYGWR